MLLSTAYFPPVQYLALLARDMTLSPDRVCPSTALMEASERYQKQSYRNRCYILGGDGVEMLQVPVVHAEDMSIRSVRVDWSTPWLVRTERALDTAYYSSAYFEYYRDELFAILEERPERLWDLNLTTLRFLLKKTGITCTLQETADFAAPFEPQEGAMDGIPDDYRFRIHPKRHDTILHDLGLEKPYFQVFADRFGFTPGLSALDLLFNEGPDSILWLKQL